MKFTPETTREIGVTRFQHARALVARVWTRPDDQIFRARQRAFPERMEAAFAATEDDRHLVEYAFSVPGEHQQSFDIVTTARERMAQVVLPDFLQRD